MSVQLSSFFHLTASNWNSLIATAGPAASPRFPCRMSSCSTASGLASLDERVRSRTCRTAPSNRLAESLPAKYNDASKLTHDVVPGENEQNYNLPTK